MSEKPKLIPYLLLAAGLIGLLLIVIAVTDVAHPRHVAKEPSLSPSTRATRTPLSTSRPVSQTAQPSPTKLPTASNIASTDTPAPTATPTAAPTPTPTSTPIAISPPFVSSIGALAYIEDSILTIVRPEDFDVTTIAVGVIEGSQALLWSPDGRQLLYTASIGSVETGSTSERQALHIWDSQRAEPLRLAHNVSDFPSDGSSIREATWSPNGTRVLFPCSPAGSACQAWVLDVTTKRAWRLPASPNAAATWMDEDTILQHSSKEGPLQLLSVGPPARVLTETAAVSETYALSPDRGYVAWFKGNPRDDQRLHILALPGRAPLSLSTQPTVTSSGDDPLWSPDGRWVAYGAEAVIPYSEKGTYTLLADTRGTRETQSFNGLLPVAWSPDSRLLASFGCSDTMCHLNVLDAVSGHTTNIVSARDMRLWDLAWSPRGVYLLYSVSGSDVDKEGLILWNRATGEEKRLIQGSEAQPLTSLQWAADGCTLYAAQGKKDDQTDRPVSAIWGVGPTWGDRWRVAPGISESPSAFEDALKQRGKDQGTQLCRDPLLDGRRVVAYYGTPLGPGLGILGRYGITETLGLLHSQVQAYRDLDPTVDTVPALHMVTSIADGFAGPDGDYNHHVPLETLRRWIDSIEADGGWSILDVQPGRAELVDELDAIESLLLEPNVHLAVDPEFIVAEGQVPGEDLGQITGPQINWIQARMDQVARASGHRKMLIIHQFDDRMIDSKEMILDYPLVDLVWDADGFGGPGAKIGDYNQYKLETGFEHGGLKIFYRYDEPVMTPQDVLALDPPPRLVIYQ